MTDTKPKTVQPKDDKPKIIITGGHAEMLAEKAKK